MIVKDEPIDRLVMLIDFMRPLTHRFVIADTGSKDYDIDRPLLEKAGATVIQTPWTYDFSAARNSTLPYLQSDWTLHLDADEMPSLSLIDFIHAVLLHTDERTLGYRIFTRNFWGGDWGHEVEEHWHCRLFRTDRAQWYKKLHEQVMLDGKKESQTGGTIVMPKAPKEAYLIHSKPRWMMPVSAARYREMI